MSTAKTILELYLGPKNCKSNNFKRSAKVSHQEIRFVRTPCQIVMRKIVTARL